MLKHFTVRCLSALCWLLTGVQARWLNNQPSKKSRIYYANHSSHLDGLVIWLSLPTELRQRTHPLAAQDYWQKTPLRRYLALNVFKAVLIHRHSKTLNRAESVLQKAKALLSNGESLIIFPEGTRGNGDEITSFRSGLYHLAKKFPHTEIVPVYLENLNRVLPKGSYLVVPIICSATFGPTLTPLGDQENKKDYLARAKYALEALVP